LGTVSSSRWRSFRSEDAFVVRMVSDLEKGERENGSLTSDQKSTMTATRSGEWGEEKFPGAGGRIFQENRIHDEGGGGSS